MSAVPSEDEIKAILAGASAYSPSNKSKLEAYIGAQASGKAAYSFDANRTLLKLYQFYPPSSASEEDKGKEGSNSALALLLALLQYPATTDLLALSCLVPERIQTQEPCASILKCAELLDACQFAEFWTTYKSLEANPPAAIAAVPLSQHHAKLQAAICAVLALTYRTAPLSVATVALNVGSGSELSGRKDLPQIESVDASNVYFAPTADNTKRNRVFQDVDFNSISSLMTKIVRE
mgnify:CR=1 FL=1